MFLRLAAVPGSVALLLGAEAGQMVVGIGLQNVQLVELDIGFGMPVVQLVEHDIGFGMPVVQLVEHDIGFGMPVVQLVELDIGFGMPVVQLVELDIGFGMPVVQLVELDIGFGMPVVQLVELDIGFGMPFVQLVAVDIGFAWLVFVDIPSSGLQIAQVVGLGFQGALPTEADIGFGREAVHVAEVDIGVVLVPVGVDMLWGLLVVLSVELKTDTGPTATDIELDAMRVVGVGLEVHQVVVAIGTMSMVLVASRTELVVTGTVQTVADMVNVALYCMGAVVVRNVVVQKAVDCLDLFAAFQENPPTTTYVVGPAWQRALVQLVLMVPVVH